MTDAPELLPCPFCGCETIHQREHSGVKYHECDWCQASGPVGDPTAEYPETWQTRTDIHTSVVAERDALRAEVERLRNELVPLLALHAGRYGEAMFGDARFLHPQHYDRMAELGGRMDDFTRAALTEAVDAAGEGEG